LSTRNELFKNTSSQLERLVLICFIFWLFLDRSTASQRIATVSHMALDDDPNAGTAQTTNRRCALPGTGLDYTLAQLRTLVEQANLGIDIDNATCAEWVQTAQHDTNQAVLRLRHPVTKEAFSLDNLKRIFSFLSESPNSDA
jgi:hypothetical protein